jgi:hypothetical protein
MLVKFLQGLLSVFLIVAGIGLYLFSIGVAFGWDRGPFSVIGAIIAILGLSMVFWGYWAIRESEWAPLAATCLTIALGLGSTFVIVGVLFLVFKSEYTPTGYFIVIGCLSIPAFYRFRAYLKHQTAIPKSLL